MSLLVSAAHFPATTSYVRSWPYWWVWLIIAAVFVVVLFALRGGARRPRPS